MGEANLSTASSLTLITKSFVLCVNIGFYCLVVPFRLKYDPHTDALVAVRSTGLCKILSLLLPFLGQLMLAVGVLSFVPYKPDIDQTAWILNIVGNVGWWLLSVIVTTELWRRSEEFATMANNMIAMEREMLKLGIGVHWAFKYPAIFPVFLHLHMLALNLWEMEGAGARLHFSENPFPLLHILDAVPGGSVASIMLNNICYTILEHYNQITHFVLNMIWFLSFILFVLASSFRRHSERRSSDQEVFKICILLARLSYSGRRCLGSVTLARVLLLLPYFALRVQDVFGESLDLRLIYCYYMGRFVVDLALAAEAHAQVNSFAKALVAENAGHGLCKSKSVGDCPWLNFKTKMLLLDVLNGEGIGVKGRGLTITYFFFGTIMASILSYSIAILQLQIT